MFGQQIPFPSHGCVSEEDRAVGLEHILDIGHFSSFWDLLCSDKVFSMAKDPTEQPVSVAVPSPVGFFVSSGTPVGRSCSLEYSAPWRDVAWAHRLCQDRGHQCHAGLRWTSDARQAYWGSGRRAGTFCYQVFWACVQGANGVFALGVSQRQLWKGDPISGCVSHTEGL